MKVTKQQILYIMPHAKSHVAKYIDYINKYAVEFDITTPLRMAHYLAQIAHESVELQYSEEIASGDAYEGRKDLGNTHPCDGRRYKGRGLIQITGRYNYGRYKVYCGFDVLQKPYLLAQPLGAVRSSMWYWKTHGCNELADRDDVRGVTRAVNGGYNGLAQRLGYLERAKRAFGIG